MGFLRQWGQIPRPPDTMLQHILHGQGQSKGFGRLATMMYFHKEAVISRFLKQKGVEGRKTDTIFLQKSIAMEEERRLLMVSPSLFPLGNHFESFQYITHHIPINYAFFTFAPCPVFQVVSVVRGFI